MTLKIGLISDVHATPAPLQEALSIFHREGIETILCAGDIAGYGLALEETVALLIENRCRVILGNHDLWHLHDRHDEPPGPVDRYLRTLPVAIELAAEGKTLYMVHASPPASLMEGIRLLDENAVLIAEQKDSWSRTLQDFNFDLLVVGHTHQVFVQRLGPVLVINPGSTLFNHTCMVLCLPEMTVEIHPLQGRSPVLAWHWGQLNEMDSRSRLNDQ